MKTVKKMSKIKIKAIFKLKYWLKRLQYDILRYKLSITSQANRRQAKETPRTN